jgi:hypothetical protein
MNGTWTRWPLVWLAVMGMCSSIQAGQTNSWNSSTSGNWEGPGWSLGVRPGPGQTIQLTNHGWKAVAIGPATAANFPDTMTVDALNVTSPGTDTVNTVLFNYAGYQTPFVTQSLNVSNDAQVVVLGSALNVQYGGLVVDGGLVTEDAASQVSAGGLQIQGGGVYDLKDGTLTVPQPGWEDIVGGQFHQEGGSNFCYTLADSGEYNLSGGDLVVADRQSPGTGMQVMGDFIQTGGTLKAQMNVGAAGHGGGRYALSNGIIHCSFLLLPTAGGGVNPDTSYFVQSGGTNFGRGMYVGAPSVQYNYPWFGMGYYTLGNGLLVTSNIMINGHGAVTQSGGVHSNSTVIMTQSDFFHQEQPGGHSYTYFQPGAYSLSGGTLVSDLMDMEPGIFSQTGGSAQIATLQMVGGQYGLSGGQLTASNITLSGGANFTQTGGSVTQTGTLYLNDSHLAAGSGPQIFGKLQLGTAGGTNSTITFPPGLCGVFFVNSSSLNWSNAAMLIISNWSGALFGGGAHRITFGTDHFGLTSQQLSRIQFSNPAGLPNGIYPARILSNGEVVPDQNQGSEGSGTANSWISQTGGNWDDASSWSLGVPPASSQDIFFTNPYWKAVTIDSSTVSSVPESLAVKSLTITSVSAPDGSYTTKNTLLLNYAQPGNPLVIGVDTNNPGSLFVDHDSTLAMYYSGLIVNDALGETNSRIGEFQVDGNFIQSDNSEVVAGFLDLTGNYNLTNGMLYVGRQFINGRFNQQGGTNTGSIDMQNSGDYELFDGAFNGDITIDAGAFTQWGGKVSAQLILHELSFGGVYRLMGGTLLPGTVDLGSAPLVLSNLGFPGGSIDQGGGTNNATSITIGMGFYHLTNGVMSASSLTLTTNDWGGFLYAGDFEQYGGYATNGGIAIIGGTNYLFAYTNRVAARYNLHGGILETPSITMNTADFSLGNATNRVHTLSMSASTYAMSGGLLAASQLQLTNSSDFQHSGGILFGAANLTMANARWTEQGTGAQLGQLQVLSDSVVTLPFGSCVLQFAGSSGVAWSGGAHLTIEHWSGSVNGSGTQQIFFGTSGSGLSSQQLGQVIFDNPPGLPTGMYTARILSNGEIVPDQNSSTSGPVDSWIKPTSGNWDDPSAWSLGVLPNSTGSVLIANSGSKAVAINPSTPIDFPGSMTVTSLLIRGATNTENTLLLNNFGIGVPLTVLNGLTLQDGAQILNFNSGLIVDGGAFQVTNSDIIQDGGLIHTTNQMTLNDSQFYISNGVFEAASVALGFPRAAHFNQYGGTATITNIGFGSFISGPIPNGISLYGGTLNLPGGMDLFGEGGGVSYFQAGGTNHTGGVVVEADYGGFIGGFTLNGGLLADSSFVVYSGYDTSQSITQNGGSHVITNSLYLAGGYTHGYPDPATYNLNGGTLSAGTIELDANQGDSVFNQTNASTSAGTFYAHSGGYFSSLNSYVNLSGGTLSCSNYITDDGHGQLNQSGGALVVSNLLNFGGSRYVGGPFGYLYGQYTFTGGTVAASNINIGGVWSIGDGTTNRISNPGTFTLSHLLQINNANEQLGHFILASNATIDLAGSASRLSFANSSGQAWNAGATLVVTDWNGDASGGGAEQLKFGTDSSGLTPAQLNQILFNIGTNQYAAKILNTGEVVPNQAIAPPVAFSTQGNNFVVTWPAGWSLQSATNTCGPWNDVPSATSPYTNDMTLAPQRFFRLRQ